ncbi:MAG TPA: tetratricopeptide repeat protein [Bryobacteraceae bacterium]|nr:tetratricopeptide repeat protein [Bryobacteraceae bacterium]
MKRALLLVGIAALVLAGTGCKKLQSRDQLNKGVQAFKNAQYDQAIDHFNQAVELDPSNPNARLYLATSYFVQYIPGAPSPENLEYARKARGEFLKVLQQDPKDKTALNYLASLSLQEASGESDLDSKLKKLDDAREWYLKLIAVDPKNKEAYYSLGFIDWSKWYPRWMEALNKQDMRPDMAMPFKDKKIKAQLAEQWGSLVDDGLNNMKMALDIDKNYDEAMAYMNLLIRERASLADSQEAYKKDIDTADDWVQKSLEAKKIKASKQVGNQGITAEPAK